MAIQSFACAETANCFYDGKPSHKAGWAQVSKVAHRKLTYLDAATAIDDLRSPPGNRLEALSGDLAGLWSVRVNEQWRVVFRWENGSAYDVRIVDYHS